MRIEIKKNNQMVCLVPMEFIKYLAKGFLSNVESDILDDVDKQSSNFDKINSDRVKIKRILITILK